MRSAGLNNSRTHALYRAGLQLLVRRDLDKVSIADVAQGAGCSVGAFYERFEDKSAYLTFVISHQLQSAISRLENEVTRISAQFSGSKTSTEKLANFIVDELSSAELAGVVRAALKLAPTNPEALAPITEYRNAANELIYAALKTGIKFRDTKRRIEEGLQIIFAVIFDALQQNHGPLTLNNARISAVLARQFQARLSDHSKMPAGPLFNKGKLRSGGKRTQEIAVAHAKAADAVMVPATDVKDTPSGKAKAEANTNRRRRTKL